MNGDAARHAGLHRQIDACGNRAVPEIRARDSHQFLIRGDHRFPARNGRFHNLTRSPGAAHQFHHDLNVRMIHHFPPMRRLQRGIEGGRQRLGRNSAAAERADFERKAQFERDAASVLRQDVKSPGTNVAETDNANIHRLHGISI